MRTLLLAGALLLLAGADRGPLDAFGWLAGCWELKDGARVTLEMRMSPEGGLMPGASRTTVNGVTRGTEVLRLEAVSGDVFYVAFPSGQAETRFRATVVSDSGFTVENPAHDFPTRITYRRVGSDSLVARIEGPGRGGGMRGVDFPFRRVSCTVEP